MKYAWSRNAPSSIILSGDLVTSNLVKSVVYYIIRCVENPYAR